MTNYVLVAVFCLLTYPSLLFSAEVYSENFEDEAIGDLPYGEWERGTTSPVQIDGGGSLYSGVEDTDWEFYSVGNGRSGTGIRSINANDTILMVWQPGGEWISDEVYISFYKRYANFSHPVGGDSNENLKCTYLYWGTGQYSAYQIYSSGTASFYSCYDQDLDACQDTYYPGTGGNDLLDGDWHRYEHYVNMDTGNVKVWIDGDLVLDDTNGSGWVASSLAHVTFNSIDALTQGDYDYVALDDIEVWSSMPDEADESEIAGVSGGGFSIQ